jgi:division protein CdvB (Snf7/Vps24/ESCRT-III family)
MTHDVFISYSNRDKAVADALCATLENRKIRCWIAPRDILPSEDYASTLITAISSSRILLLVFSKDSNASQFVMREVNAAVSRGIPIIPFRIEDVKPTQSMEFLLGTKNWLDALTPPLERHLLRLADTVQTLLQSNVEKLLVQKEVKPESPSKMKLVTTSNLHDLSKEDVSTIVRNWEKLSTVREEKTENRSDVETKKFSKKWESKNEGIPFSQRIKDNVKPPGPFKQRLDFAARRLELQIRNLDQARERFSQRRKAINARMIDAYAKNDSVRANVFANELAEVREKELLSINAQVSLEQVILRLLTLSELGDLVTNLGPAVGVIRSIGTRLVSMFPETENELGEIGNLLSGVIVEAGQTSGMTLNFDTVKKDAFKILEEASTAAEQRVKEKFPDLQQSIPTNVVSLEQPENDSKKGDSSHSLTSKTSEVPGDIIDNVHFSVTSPSQVCQGISFLVDVWAHLGKQRDEVIQRAKEALPNVEISIKSKGPVSVSRGTVLTVRLKIDELEVENSEDTIMWKNEIGNANFRVTVPKKTTQGSKPGTTTIHANGLQIARIYFNVEVGTKISSTKKIKTKVQLNRKAFASYASEDRDYVLACIQIMQKFSPQLDVDMDLKIRSGQYWEKELWRRIPSKDVFYLFWSRNSAKSEWVEKEWRCALEKRGLDFIDPVALVDPERVPPPPELSSKQFNDWTTSFMRGKLQ